MAIKSHPEAIKHLPVTEQAVIIRIFNRVSLDNKNALIAVTGGTGSGKSYAVLSIMIGLYLYQFGEYPPVEYVREHSVFKARDFLRKINNPNLKPLECWMFDEAGVDINSKNHATNHNKALNFVVQTFRHLQQIVFFTVPSFSFMDKSVRCMIHYKYETVAINKQKKTNKGKFFLLDYNERQDKTYFKYIKVRVGDYRAKIKRVNTLLIPKEYADCYEEQKSEYSNKLRENIEMTLAKAEEKEQKELSGDVVELTEAQQRVWDAYNHGCLLQKDIAKRLGIGVKTVSEHVQRLKKRVILFTKEENP